MLTKPTFINVGPGRCGTSWMHSAFLAHPDIGMARVKETEFFNTNLERGFAWYEKQFLPQNTRCLGEISNNYYLDPEVANRIATYNASMRIIFNIRKPENLMESFYRFGVRRGLDLPPIGQSTSQPIGRLMGSGYEQRMRAGQLNASDTPTLLESVLLSRWLKPFLERFPSEQIYIFDYERFSKEPEPVMRELFSFVGADEAFSPENGIDVVNASIEPRFRLLGRAASMSAAALRSLGAYALLSRLHQSRAIKNALFRPAISAGTSAEVRKKLTPADSEMLLKETEKILKLVPEARSWWQ